METKIAKREDLEQDTEVARYVEPTPLTAVQIRHQVNLIQEVMREVMIEGKHYGKIPGCGDKPALFKDGAEKLRLTFRLAPKYNITQVDHTGGHREFKVVCALYSTPSDIFQGEGIGSCSTLESKYRYREGKRKCPACGSTAIIKGKEEYGGGWLCFKKNGGCGTKFKNGDPSIEGQQIGKIENPDLADAYNTVLKMAKKRAFVDAILTVTAASDIFTQDLEDLVDDVHAPLEVPYAPTITATRVEEPPQTTTMFGEEPKKNGNGNGNGGPHYMTGAQWEELKKEGLKAGFIWDKNKVIGIVKLHRHFGAPSYKHITQEIYVKMMAEIVRPRSHFRWNSLLTDEDNARIRAVQNDKDRGFTWTEESIHKLAAEKYDAPESIWQLDPERLDEFISDLKDKELWLFYHPPQNLADTFQTLYNEMKTSGVKDSVLKQCEPPVGSGSEGLQAAINKLNSICPECEGEGTVPAYDGKRVTCRFCKLGFLEKEAKP